MYIKENLFSLFRKSSNKIIKGIQAQTYFQFDFTIMYIFFHETDNTYLNE